MRKIKLYIAASLDGYIARPDGEIDWLTSLPDPRDGNFGYTEFIDSVSTIIMGGQTYRDLLTMTEEWPYKDKVTYVVTHHAAESNDYIRFITEDVVENISDVRIEGKGDIWLVGGGKIISMLLNANLVDSMQIFHIPVILGEGIRLFPDKTGELRWELQQSKSYDNGVVEVVYSRL